MKNMKQVPVTEPRTAALAIGLAIGLGLVVHEIFFLIALALGVVVTAESAINAARAHGSYVNLLGRH